MKYHFVGIGGIGMSGLAKLLLKSGASVSGSDQEDSEVVRKLGELGAAIYVGHDAAQMPEELDAVVISAAIRESNQELARAREGNMAVFKYAEMLGDLMERLEGIAICGTHGKSTTSGWLAVLMERAGASPSFIVGAEVGQLGSSSGAGNGRHFIAEACEYDRSFLNLHPKIAVMLNIEQDHLDYYKDEADIVDAFTEFARGIGPGGVLIANGQDANVQRVLEALDGKVDVRTFGIDGEFDVNASDVALVDGKYSFDLCRKGTCLGRVENRVSGMHNVMNALAVAAAAMEAGINPADVVSHLPAFSGIDRRLMFKDRVDGVTILDDYAHHPTEIRASLEAIREQYHPQRLWCIFQPHQYSRTRFLLDDFAESFKLADVTIVPEIYFVRDTAEAREKVNAEVLARRICEQGSQAMFIDSFAGICEHLKENVRSGDLIVTMGAGDIWKVADEYIRWLREDR